MNKAEEDFILKWGFERGQPCFDAIRKDLDELFKSRVNAIGDYEIEKKSNLLASIDKDFVAIYRGGAKWFKEQLLKQ